MEQETTTASAIQEEDPPSMMDIEEILAINPFIARDYDPSIHQCYPTDTGILGIYVIEPEE